MLSPQNNSCDKISPPQTTLSLALMIACSLTHPRSFHLYLSLLVFSAFSPCCFSFSLPPSLFLPLVILCLCCFLFFAAHSKTKTNTKETASFVYYENGVVASVVNVSDLGCESIHSQILCIISLFLSLHCSVTAE